ncbi:4Fe-4S dicluster domain-containing protein [Roseivirga pacifica]|uniref:4Fe-4S dicluster domain-containing protein n=1 Tax=Roseivirga pacifica TaxID=1267423 RepID=UPI003BAF8C88
MSRGIHEYWRNIKTATSTLKTGLKVTFEHMLDARNQRAPLPPSDDNYFEKKNALFTVQYPREVLPVPEHGRYKLHNEIDDCIVCDKCAKVCPVNCIDIEPVRGTGEIGKTSDGTSKRIYAAKFDIDMAKCCFCGLCTTVCPTECLTMTSDYDFSAFDFEEHNVPFATMTPMEILEKKKELEEFNAKKEAEKAAKATPTTGAKPAMKPRVGAPKPAVGAKPAVKPSIKPKVGGAAKPVIKPKVPSKNTEEAADNKPTRPVIKPKVPGASAKPKPVIKPKIPVKKASTDEEKKPQVKPVVRPKIPVKKQQAESDDAKKPQARPVIKPKVQAKKEGSEDAKPAQPRPKVPMRPKIPPRKQEGGDEE